MKQTPKTGPDKTPESWTLFGVALALMLATVVFFAGYHQALADVDAVSSGAGAAAGACARGRLGAVPLGNTGTTTVEGTR